MQGFDILLWDLYRDKMTVDAHIFFKIQVAEKASLGYGYVSFGQISVIAGACHLCSRLDCEWLRKLGIVLSCCLGGCIGTRYFPAYTDVPSHLGAGPGGGRHEGSAELLSHRIFLRVLSVTKELNYCRGGHNMSQAAAACSQEARGDTDWAPGAAPCPVHSPSLSHLLRPVILLLCINARGERQQFGFFPRYRESIKILTTTSF